jgi:hypothetical protein
MFVDERTWTVLSEKPEEREVLGYRVRLPRPEQHMVALKLHSATSPDRSKPEADWEDIRQIVHACSLDCEEPGFREVILKFGGEAALERISCFRK